MNFNVPMTGRKATVSSILFLILMVGTLPSSAAVTRFQATGQMSAYTPAGSSSVQVSFPANVALTSLLVANVTTFRANGGAATITMPGWNRVVDSQGAAPGISVFWRVGDGGRTYTVNTSDPNGNWFSVELLEYGGLDMTAPYDVSASQSSAYGAITSGTTVMTAQSNELAVAVLAAKHRTRDWTRDWWPERPSGGFQEITAPRSYCCNYDYNGDPYNSYTSLAVGSFDFIARARAPLSTTMGSIHTPEYTYGAIVTFKVADAGTTTIESYGGASSGAPTLLGRSARGTDTAPTAVQNGDQLLTLFGRGFGATAFSAGARAALQLKAAENWSDSAQGSFITLSTTPTGSTSLAERFRIDPLGNVGVGTAAPSSLLTVNGTVQSLSGGFRFPDGTLQATAAAGGSASQWTTGTGNIYYSGGSVGIGTSAPAAPLSVAGLIQSTTGGFKFPDGSVQTTASAGGATQWSAGTNTVYYNLGNVGIGTASPSVPLHVFGPSQVSGTGRRTMIVTDSTAAAQGVGGGIAFGGYYSAAGAQTNAFAIINGLKENATDNNSAGALVLATRPNGGNPTERMRIASDGLVSVGTAGDSGIRLSVNGDISVSGNINAKYQDFAEWVVSSKRLPRGTVVVIDRVGIDRVTRSSDEYDTSVAGVVSDEPGVLLGEPAMNKEKIATSGRVLVHVDATKRPIRIGDLLVSSKLPGRAMASDPIQLPGGEKIHRPGTIIGKALQPLDHGQGEILVLLSLQ